MRFTVADGHKHKRAIWGFVSEHPDSTLDEIAARVDLSRSSTHRYIGDLLKSGVLFAPRGATGCRKTRGLRAPVPLITIAKDGEQWSEG